MNCKHCGNEFVPKNTIQIFCSATCRLNYVATHKTDYVKYDKAKNTEKCRKYRESHRDEVASYINSWRSENRDTLNAYHRNWYSKNKTAISERRKARRLELKKSNTNIPQDLIDSTPE